MSASAGSFYEWPRPWSWSYLVIVLKYHIKPFFESGHKLGFGRLFCALKTATTAEHVIAATAEPPSASYRSLKIVTYKLLADLPVEHCKKASNHLVLLD